MLHSSAAVTAYICLLAGILGACMGSFLNCWAWRSLRREPIWKGRSHCDACAHVLTAADIIPVVSFLLSRGRCRYCGTRLSWRHPAAEGLGAAIFISILLRYELSLRALWLLTLLCVLLAASLADLDKMRIPDRFILTGAVGGLIFPLLTAEPWQALGQALLGGVSVAGVLLLVVLVMEKAAGRELMGGGDIKLLFVTGLYLGWMENLLCLVLACVIGIVFGLCARKKDAPIPWGPAIGLSAWGCCLFGNEVVQAYLRLF